MQIKYKKVSESAITPTRGSQEAAGLDLYAHFPEHSSGCIVIPSQNSTLVSTGVAMEIPPGCFGAIFARSGLASREGLRPANCVGVIDSDYRGTIMVSLYNDSGTTRVIKDGDRIAQLVIMPYLDVELKEVGVLQDTNRGEGGFGSTGM